MERLNSLSLLKVQVMSTSPGAGDLTVLAPGWKVYPLSVAGLYALSFQQAGLVLPTTGSGWTLSAGGGRGMNRQAVSV